ncbi:MAG: hypothetical protein K2W82_16625 [Candidatus Obscuribacterales bacterium]|nr:hypothetical protein [Candidatus Obscuribacterales bacterium]
MFAQFLSKLVVALVVLAFAALVNLTRDAQHALSVTNYAMLTIGVLIGPALVKFKTLPTLRNKLSYGALLLTVAFVCTLLAGFLDSSVGINKMVVLGLPTAVTGALVFLTGSLGGTWLIHGPRRVVTRTETTTVE